MPQNPPGQLEDLACLLLHTTFDLFVELVERGIAGARWCAHERHDRAEARDRDRGDDHRDEIGVAVPFSRHECSQLEERNREKQQHDWEREEDDPCRGYPHRLSLQRLT